MARRSYGSGSLFVRSDATGRESWYGRWYTNGRQLQRRIGYKRRPGTREGLTRVQAERELAQRVELERPAVRSGLTIKSAAERYLNHLELVLERKPTTIGDYRSMLRRHIEPFFGTRALERIDSDRIRAFLAAKKKEGLATKTVINQLVFLHGLFAFALKRGWVVANPVASVDRPRAVGADPDIHYLDLAEMEALLGAIPDDDFGATERALYLTAAMSGLRQGELVALRWTDVDWRASRIRVRRNYTRQRFGTPKSRRSSRSVPMIERVARELNRHYRASAFQGEEDLVFAHPQTGHPLDASKLRKRFKDALERVELRPIRFHDLRHTFGTHCASAGVPLRTLQEWLGHRDFKTTLVYADYAPSPHEADLLERAFRSGEAKGTPGSIDTTDGLG